MNKKCIFLHVPVMDTGGQERFVSNLTTILKDDYEVKVILFDDTIIGYPLDCEYISLKTPAKAGRNGLFSLWLQVWRLRSLIRKYKPHASISFGNRANLVNIFAKTRKCMTLISIRGYAGLDKFRTHSLKGLIWRLIVNKADKIICVSMMMAEELKDMLPGLREKVCVLNNAYDVTQIRRLSEQDTEFDSLFKDYDVIVTVGVLRPEKGYCHLIKAFSMLRKTRSKIKLLHIGSDYLNYGEKINKLISDLGLMDDVILLGHRDNPYKYCAKSKVYVLSSLAEGFPNALVEAMACGVPVIATDCKTGPGEILADCTCAHTEEVKFADYGLLVPPFSNQDNDDPLTLEKGHETLAQAIAVLLDDPELAKEFGRKAGIRAATYSYNRCRETVTKIIDHLDYS